MIERSLLALAVLLTIVVATSLYVDQSLRPSDDHHVDSPPSSDVNFIGNVNGDNSLTVNGTLHLSTNAANHTRYENVSIRLYDENGSLLRSECLGELTVLEPIDVSLQYSGVPEYVVVASPGFWQKNTVGSFQVDYYYRRGSRYQAWWWASPGDVDVDITRHRPCQ